MIAAMFTVVITEKGGAQKRLTFEEPEVTIGRVPGNDIVLPKGNVSKRHSRIVLKDSRFIVVDLKSTNGTYVNGRKITSPLVVKEGDKIYIGDYIMTLEGDPALSAPSEAMRQPSVMPPPADPDAAKAQPASAPPPLPSRAPDPLVDDGIPAVLRSSPSPSLRSGPASTPTAPPTAQVPGMAALKAPATGFSGQGQPQQAQPSVSSVPSVPPVLSAYDDPEPEPLLERTQAQAPLPEATNVIPYASAEEHSGARTKNGARETARKDTHAQPPKPSEPAPSSLGASPRSAPPALNARASSIPPATRDDLRSLMHRLGRDLDTDNADPAGLLDERRWEKAERTIQSKLGELTHEGAIARDADKALLASAALHEAVGLGPLDGLLADTAVLHVIVERFDRVRVDRGDGLKLEETAFSSPQGLLTAVRRLLAQAGGIDRGESTFDVSLANGLHLVGALPAAATEGPVISLRRRPRKIVPLSELKRDAVLDAEQMKRLTDALAAGKNVLFVGPRAADLATLMASALDTCPAEQRVAVFEYGPELALGERSAICLKRGTAPFAELAMRVRHFRPDRCLIHELSRAELPSALSSLLSRGDGSMASMERPSARDALAELTAAAGELGPDGLDQVQRALQLVVGMVHESGRPRLAGVFALRLEDGALKLLEG